MIDRDLALIYSRKSVVHDPAHEISNERQEAACIQIAERQGLRYEVYRDQDISGRTEERPNWQRLKARLADPEVQAVIVESLSRASRSVKDFFVFLEELEQRAITLVSVKESIDTSTAMGRAFVGFIAILNQLESDLASERMTMTIAYRQAEGRHWGLTPYGCERDENGNLIPSTEGVWLTTTGHWVVGCQEAPPFAADVAVWQGYHAGLRQLYDIYATGRYSYGTVASLMNAEGWPFRTRWGLPRRWTEDDARRVLQAVSLYAGGLPLGRQKDRHLESKVVDGAHNAILAADLCARAAAVMKQRGVTKVRRRRQHRVYLLACIAYCHACGQQLYGQMKNGIMYYRHRRKGDCPAESGHIPCEEVDRVVLNQLCALDIPLDWSLPAQQNPCFQRRQKLTAQRARLERQLFALKEMRIEGELTREEYYSHKKEVQAQLAELTEEELDPNEVDWTTILARLRNVGQVLAEAKPELQKEALQAILRRVVIDLDERDVVEIVPAVWCRPFF